MKKMAISGPSYKKSKKSEGVARIPDKAEEDKKIVWEITRRKRKETKRLSDNVLQVEEGVWSVG